MNRTALIILTVFAGVLIASLAALWINPPLPPASDTPAPHLSVAGMKVGGPLDGLVDQNGTEVDKSRFAGQYRLIFFGFTFCPTICPTELQKVATALKGLSPELRARVTPIFITIDPERDTPQALKEYMALFGQGFVGLTGSRPRIEQAIKDWRVFATRVETPEMTEYTMDHSTFVYLHGPDGQLRALFRTQDSADLISDTLTQLLDETEI